MGAYPSVTKGYLLRVSVVFAAEGTDQPPYSFVVMMPDLLQGCLGYLYQGISDVVKRSRHLDSMTVAVIAFRNNMRIIISYYWNSN